MSQGRLPLGNLLIHFSFLHHFQVPVTFATSKSDLLAKSGEFKDRLKTKTPYFTK